jgi:hypothetical protein
VPVDGTIISTTATGTVSSYTITVSSSSGLIVGQSVTGTGINSTATVMVTAISGTTVTLSHPNTGPVSGTINFQSPKSIKFKSTIPSGTSCIIYELGIFNNSAGGAGIYDGKILTNFDEGTTTGWYISSGTINSLNTTASYSPRLSNSLINVTASNTTQRVVLGSNNTSIPINSASSPAGTLSIDTKIFSNQFDTAKLLVYSTGTASITIKGQDTSTLTSASPDNAITLFSSATVSAGLNLLESTISKGSLYNDTISKLEISYGSSGSVGLYFDSLKFSFVQNSNIYFGLISKSILSTPITKTAEESIDIEYEIYLYS